MKVNRVSRKLVKPCTPTPQNLNKYKISFMDELSPSMNLCILLFYPSNSKLSNMEESLSKILAQFYPLAGRYIKKDHLVDCSDQGVEFIQAEAVDIELINLIGETEAEQLNNLLPRQSHQVDESATEPLLSIQITEFKCGGLVIGISVSHRIFDTSSVGTFIAAWSNANNPRGAEEKIITIGPIFDSPSLFPGKNRDYSPNSELSKVWDLNVRVKRFLFTKEAIMRMKSKLKLNEGKGGSVLGSGVVISRVKIVCALIAKVLIGLDRAKKGGESRCCLIVQAVNIRERIIPPLPKHSCGNLVIPSLTPCMNGTETKEMGIGELVDLLGEAIDKTVDDCAEILSLDENGLNKIIVNRVADAMEKSVSGGVNAIWFSDWSKFGFYEADFGWGEPVWAGIGPLPVEKLTVLMENKEGDGIEAWVHLKPNDMAYFEQDEEIRCFTT